MKKVYIQPNNKVHVLTLRDGILQDTSVHNVNSNKKESGEDFDGNARDNTTTSGSTNIWSNEW